MGNRYAKAFTPPDYAPIWMYTGVVESTGTVQEIKRTKGGCELRVAIATDGLFARDSIGVSGICLTAESVGDGWFEASMSAETVARTYLAELNSNDAVNIEYPVRSSGTLDGHVVKGTVDATTTITANEEREDDWWFTFAIPGSYEQYIVEKGAVALDGISLTVAAVDDDAGTFSTAIVPATYHRTTLSTKSIGDAIHFEADILAKYVDRQHTIGIDESDKSTSA